MDFISVLIIIIETKKKKSNNLALKLRPFFDFQRFSGAEEGVAEISN